MQRENTALGQSGDDYKRLRGLASAGFVSIRALEARDWSNDSEFFSDQMKYNPVLGEWITVELTPKGRGTPPQAAYWIATVGFAGNHVLIVAERKFDDVTGITMESDHDAKAEFTWHWQPTSVGEPMGCIPAPETATETFKLYDDGWRLLASSIGTPGRARAPGVSGWAPSPAEGPIVGWECRTVRCTTAADFVAQQSSGAVGAAAIERAAAHRRSLGIHETS